MKKIEVSIAIVNNSEEQFLIALRPDKVHQGGKWEFPGGKVEKNETPVEAMCRELKEEVGLTVDEYRLIESKHFDYDDCTLHLHFFLVDKFSGQAKSLEGQPIKWVSKTELRSYKFPEANQTIIEGL